MASVCSCVLASVSRSSFQASAARCSADRTPSVRLPACLSERSISSKTRKIPTRVARTGAGGKDARWIAKSIPSETLELDVGQGGGASGNGAGGGDYNGSGGGGGGRDENPDGSQGRGDAAVAAALAAAGRSAKDLPEALRNALAQGQLSAELLGRYLKMQNNPLLRFLMQFGGFRERLLGDPSFIVKLCIELGIGLVCKVAAERSKRGEDFQSQLDFVLANVVMALVADFMLTWLPAPRAILGQAAQTGNRSALQKFLASCPDNAFQRVPKGGPAYSVLQRSMAVVRNGTKLFVVGFGSSLIGVGSTNGLSSLRAMMDPSFTPQNPPQGIASTSGAYAAYMATSSNLRYQLIAGVIEARGIEAVFAGQHKLCHALSFGVRTANTYVGSLLWVDFLRLLGLQPKKPVDAPAPAPV